MLSATLALRRTLAPAVLSLRSTNSSAAASRFLQHGHLSTSTSDSSSSSSDTIILPSSFSPEGNRKLQEQKKELDRMEEETKQEREAGGKEGGRGNEGEEGQEEDDMGEKARKKASDRVDYSK